MYIYIYIYMYIYIYIYIYIIYIYIYICINVHILAVSRSWCGDQQQETARFCTFICIHLCVRVQIHTHKSLDINYMFIQNVCMYLYRWG